MCRPEEVVCSAHTLDVPLVDYGEPPGPGTLETTCLLMLSLGSVHYGCLCLLLLWQCSGE